MEELSHLLGSEYSKFLSFNSLDKTSFVMGSELWEENFDALLTLVKRYIIDVWEARKVKLYGNDSCPSELPSQCLTGNQVIGAYGKFEGKCLDKNVNGACVNTGKGLLVGLAGIGNMCMRVNGSAHGCGCVVYGSSAMTVC